MRSWRVLLILTAVSLAGLLVTGVVGALVVRRTLRPLERVAGTAAEVTALPLDQGEVTLPVRVPGADPSTEVGRVAEALDRMLRHVGEAPAARQASESRVRRFVAVADRTVRLTVADDGPGMPASLLPEVFERFVRADPARPRSAGGSGLGLAIAAGVVAAHGGKVTVTSEPGHTEFTVTLSSPLT